MVCSVALIMTTMIIKYRCVDYLKVEGGQFTNTESCGNEFPTDYDTIPQSKHLTIKLIL